MYILYFYHDMWGRHFSDIEAHWLSYSSMRPGESFWLVPGTHPDDPAYDQTWGGE